MPSGQTHLCIEGGILAACIVGGSVLTQQGAVSATLLAAFAGGFAFGMLFLSPDLDLSRSRPTRRWGPLSFLWWPYAKVFRHRGISHHVVWGPLTRLGYLAVVVGGLAAAIGAATGLRMTARVPMAEVWAAIAGVYVPNVIHVAVDAVGGRLRRRRA